LLASQPLSAGVMPRDATSRKRLGGWLALQYLPSGSQEYEDGTWAFEMTPEEVDQASKKPLTYTGPGR